ncbi:DNA primase [Nakamurella panacisegetis]|uniref:DNA primase n=1 Tax=Nakamurella panacisegetis TaxID=1090615 RepID=A0A1H0T118_9ACTN|nr:DNA primase [Nakamurella panacisegetis]SDP47659.1 DNA primase [Nakamurella panacisegetis]
MAGRISDADKERVRDANRIDSVVGDYVALKGAGGGNLKGLCPFHDEKTPSFQVSPTRGTYHCFGCGQGGDVFAFIAGIEHLDFVEAVQRLADRVGITLTMIEGGTSTRVERGSRSRLIAANKAAAAFYAAQLATDDAAPARAFLAERGFDDEAARQFSCGYAPAGWDQLFKALTAQGFTVEELDKAGLINRNGQRGPIDRFHRRLLWAIHDAAGDVVGFGARRLYDDDRLEAKYINTSETPLYKKSQLLYGLDLAKKEIARQRQVVVVEGYTDVMAMHLAGVTTAVASCGTAFGEEHISVLRRYLLDNEVIRGQVIYTFDGDSAGQKAALKAYDSDQRFASNTFIAVAPDGMDPCELRQAHGDGAVRELVAARQPLFAFAIKSMLAGFDLDTVEGRVAAAAATIPMVARIKEPDTRDGYALQLAGWLGADLQTIGSRVRQHAAAEAKAANIADRRARRATDQPDTPGQPVVARPSPRDSRTFSEREALKLVLQQPLLLAGDYSQVDEAAFTDPAYRALHLAVQAAGGPAAATTAGATAWVTSIGEHLAPGMLRSLITELAIEPLRTKSDDETRYAGAILADLQLRVAKINEAALRSELQRAEASGDSQRAGQLNADLAEMAKYRRALSERARGA